MKHKHVEPNNPEFTRTANRIKKIMAYLRAMKSLDVYKWLKTDAIYYPELIEDVVKPIDEKRFRMGDLSIQERWLLFDNLVHAHESFMLIDAVVDEYLFRPVDFFRSDCSITLLGNNN
jgi:hypothetical protein